MCGPRRIWDLGQGEQDPVGGLSDSGMLFLLLLPGKEQLSLMLPNQSHLAMALGMDKGLDPEPRLLWRLTNLSTLRMQRTTHLIPRGALVQSPKELSDLTLKPCVEVPCLVTTLQFSKAVSFRVPVLRECQ